MSLEPVAWMVEKLGYPTLCETAQGELRINAAARRVLANGPNDLRSALAGLFERGLDEGLEAALARARDGARSCVQAEGLKVVVLPENGGVLVVVARDPDELATLTRRAAAGEMAAGVAHEVANALSSVIGWCSLARNEPSAAPPEVALDRAIQGAEIARDAARQMMAWGSPDPSKRERVDVGRALEDVAALLRPSAIEGGVAIAVDAPDDLFVEGLRSELVSVVWNLAQNAIRALPRGGNLQLAANETGARVHIHVVDDGPGMSPEHAKNALERRFTTHPDGFGLGLPLVQTTVAGMDGTLRLETGIGAGCHFTVDLPRAPRTTPATGLATIKPSGVRGRVQAKGQRVLVVEDDPGVRELLRTMLEIQGFHVESFECPTRATEVAPSCDIALLDLHLGTTRGDVLLERMRGSGFRGAAAIMTGGDAPPDLDAARRPDRWLRKPFDPAELMAHLLELRGLVRMRRDDVG